MRYKFLAFLLVFVILISGCTELFTNTSNEQTNETSPSDEDETPPADEDETPPADDEDDETPLVDTPPTTPAVTITPSPTAYDYDNLNCKATGSIDIDGTSVTYKYSWVKNDITQSQYDDVTTLYVSATSVGDEWVCYAKAYSNENYSEMKSDSTIIIEDEVEPDNPPHAPTVKLTPSPIVYESDNLICEFTDAYDPDGTTDFTYEIKIYQNESEIVNTTRSGQGSISLTDIREGDVWQCSVRVESNGLYSDWVNTSVEIISEFQYQENPDGTCSNGAYSTDIHDKTWGLISVMPPVNVTFSLIALDSKSQWDLGKAIESDGSSALEGITNLACLTYFYNPSATQDYDSFDLSLLGELTNLQVVSLGGFSSFDELSDISFVSNLQDLELLALDRTSVSNLSALSTLNNLKYLRFNENNITDIAPLANVTSLESISIRDEELSDISALRTLTNLKYLTLADNRISDLSPLTNLTNLKILLLDEFFANDISPLGTLTGLDILYVEINSFNDISILSNLTNLKRLEVVGMFLDDVTSLHSLTNLEYLRVVSSFISEADCQALENALPQTEVHCN